MNASCSQDIAVASEHPPKSYSRATILVYMPNLVIHMTKGFLNAKTPCYTRQLLCNTVSHMFDAVRQISVIRVLQYA